MIKRLAAHVIGMSVAGFARALTGVLPNWRGCLPEARQRVYFANHASHGDFVLIWTVLPYALRRATRPVAAVDYWGGGLRGFIGREVFNAVLVDRSGATREPISVIMEAMEQGTLADHLPRGHAQHRRPGAAAIQERPLPHGRGAAGHRIRPGMDRQHSPGHAQG